MCNISKTHRIHIVNYIFSHLAVFLLYGFGLFLAAPAHAQIGILDSSSIAHGTSVNISAPFTVSAGAKVLVVELINRENAAGPNLEPLTLAWGSQSLIQAAETNNGATSYRDVTIYYLYNPTAGTGNITGTASNVTSGVTDTWLDAFTLTNVDTTIAPLPGAVGTVGGNFATSLANTVSGVPANAWAAVNSVVCVTSATLGVNVPGGTQITTTDNADGSSTVTMGSVSGLATGANQFTATASASQKMALTEAIFLPPAPPTIVKQPEPQSLYSGGMVHFSVIAAGVINYQWYSNNVALAGATNNTLTYGSGSANVVAGVNYDVVVANSHGSVTSSIVTVSIRTPSEPFETAVANLGPYTFYQLNETANPATTAGGATAFDNANSLNGIYDTDAQNGFNGITGPTSSTGFPGFSSGNTAFQPVSSDANSAVTLPSLNLNTNTVTIAAWINPASSQLSGAGLVVCRGATSVAGLDYSATNYSTDYPLGYNWNNDPNTFNWNSGIIVPQGQWSLAVLTVTPTNATIYLLNTNGIVSAQHNYPHVVQSFNGTTWIGGDPASANQIFSGIIDDVAVFKKALTRSQIYAMFYAASGQTNYGPMIAVQPASATVYAGQTATFSVTGGGSDPLFYQWQVDTGTGPTNINNGGQFSGATSSTLTINNTTSANAGTYYVILSNAWNTVTSSPGATLTVNSTGAAENITLSVQQPAATDWDSSGYWNDGQGGLPASVSAAEFPGSTYELLAGSRMRTPTTSSLSTFPGNQLTVDGNGVWINNPAAGSLMAEIRIKEETLAVNNWSVNFPKLVMNGGQIDIAPDPVYVGYTTIGGEMDVLSNTPIYNDNGALADNDGIYLTAWLTGGGTVEYHGDTGGTIAFNNLTNNLNVACTTNTFHGTWNIVSGILLGSAPGSLGTNSITIGSTNAALETSYNVNNTNANFVLYGQMFLHQNDTFKSVFVNGTPLTNGTYSFTTLNSSYPSNFPSSWAMQNGSTVNTGSGQIVVLANPAPIIVTQPQPVTLYAGQQATFSATAAGNMPLHYQWFTNGTVALSDNANRIGSTSNVLTIPSVTSADADNYTIVVTNIYGAATSSVAPLTVLATGPAINLTLNYGGTPIVQPQGSDWNTSTNWVDGQPASVSALSNPGSTYEVVVGSRLRTPAGTNNNIFPGVKLTVDGSGIFENNTLVNIGEFRIKNNNTSSTNWFNNLVLSGGQMDIGDNILAIIQGI